MNDMVQGLEVSALGIFVTFLALSVFILIMIVLQRLFPAERVEKVAAPPEVDEAAISVVETAVSAEDDAVIAAIAAALGYLHSQERSTLGEGLTEDRSGWWASRRLEARVGKVEKR